jgi:hypothetical protein
LSESASGSVLAYNFESETLRGGRSGGHSREI